MVQDGLENQGPPRTSVLELKEQPGSSVLTPLEEVDLVSTERMKAHTILSGLLRLKIHLTGRVMLSGSLNKPERKPCLPVTE